MSTTTKVLFSINPGRSGSHYLSKLFSYGNNCKSYHEARPVGNEEAMRKFFQGDDNEIKNIAKTKADKINTILKDNSTYVETNHCFIKGFGWFISNYLNVLPEQIGVIILRRDIEQFAQSTYRIGCRPLYQVGRNWLITPELINPIISPPSRFGLSAKNTYNAMKRLNYPFSGKPPFIYLKRLIEAYSQTTNDTESKSARPSNYRSDDDKISDNEIQGWKYSRSLIQFIRKYEIDCIKWCHDETYALAELYKNQFSEFKFFDVNVMELNEYTKVKEMMNYFEIEYNEEINESIDIATNKDTQTRI